MVTANRIRLTGLLTRSPRSARASLLAAALCLCATAAAAPAPDAPLPREPAALAFALETTTHDLTKAIGNWRSKSSAAPTDVVLLALYEQRIYRLLAGDRRLSRATLNRLPNELRRVASDFLTAHRELYRLTPPIRARAIKVGPARRSDRRGRRPSCSTITATRSVGSAFPGTFSPRST